jgi:hypothetical protein
MGFRFLGRRGRSRRDLLLAVFRRTVLAPRQLQIPQPLKRIRDDSVVTWGYGTNKFVP